MAIALFGVQIMSKLNEFGFARQTLAEAMLVGVENLVCIEMTHEVAHHDLLQQFAAYACQRHRAVVGRVVSTSLIM